MPKPETYSYIGSKEGQKAQGEVMRAAYNRIPHGEELISVLPRNPKGTVWQVLTMSKIVRWQGPIIWEHTFEYSKDKNFPNPAGSGELNYYRNKVRRIEEDFAPVEYPEARWL